MTIDWDRCFAPRAVKLTASEIRELLKLLNQPDIISFAGGIPDPKLFPYEKLRAAFDAILDDPARRAEAMQYSVSEGYKPLREAIVRNLAKRGIATHCDNVLITNGSQQGLEFLAKLLIQPGDRIIVTRPSYLGALQAFGLYEPVYVPVPIAAEGIDLAAAARAFAAGAKFLYVTPDFGNPSGVTVPEDQRRALLGLSYRHGVPVIEDQAYDVLRYDGAPIPSLLALDCARKNEAAPLSAPSAVGNVIYTGTFSKSVAPALRIGWIVAPMPVIHKLVLIKQASDLHAATLNQMVLAEICESVIDDRTEELRATYGARRDAMLAALAQHMPKGVSWTRPDGGMFVWVTLPPGLDAKALLARAIQHARVAFVPGSAFFTDHSGANTLRLSFSLAPPAMITEGIRRLAGVVAEALATA